MDALLDRINNSSKKHIYIQAETGTGKTLSYLSILLTAVNTKKH